MQTRSRATRPRPKPATVALRDRESEPVSRIVWRERSELTANDYNPNRVAPPELELLILSILEDGWTQPIVILPDGAIVDGFHRWMVSVDPRLVERYGGWVPTATIEADPVHRRMSTVRHNRARGTHAVMPMAEIVRDIAQTTSRDDIMRRLGMEDEEVARLLDRSGMPVQAGRIETQWPLVDGFRKAWKLGDPNANGGSQGGPPDAVEADKLGK
jgi:hypothetical protein